MTIPELMQIQDLLGRYAQELAHRGRVTSWATCADIASQARNDAEPGRAEFCDHEAEFTTVVAMLPANTPVPTYAVELICGECRTKFSGTVTESKS